MHEGGGLLRRRRPGHTQEMTSDGPALEVDYRTNDGGRRTAGTGARAQTAVTVSCGNLPM